MQRVRGGYKRTELLRNMDKSATREAYDVWEEALPQRTPDYIWARLGRARREALTNTFGNK
eukprot:9063610-Pyramimonas_sp.AAC.1